MGGHFPSAKSRLISLLRKTSPRGLIILSGDVHHAEISGKPSAGSVEVQHNNVNAGLEFTSSGLTHTCESFGIVCEIVLRYFRSHRRMADDVFTGLNFGT